MFWYYLVTGLEKRPKILILKKKLQIFPAIITESLATTSGLIAPLNTRFDGNFSKWKKYSLYTLTFESQVKRCASKIDEQWLSTATTERTRCTDFQNGENSSINTVIRNYLLCILIWNLKFSSTWINREKRKINGKKLAQVINECEPVRSVRSGARAKKNVSININIVRFD